MNELTDREKLPPEVPPHWTEKDLKVILDANQEAEELLKSLRKKEDSK